MGQAKMMEWRRDHKIAAAIETAVFPLRFRQERPGEPGLYEALASGFLISGWGLFVTARHCVATEDGPLHDFRDLEVLVPTARGLVGCDVLGLTSHATADLAIGAIKRPSPEMQREWSFKIAALRISRDLPIPGERLISFGWARTRLSQADPDADVHHDLDNGTFEGRFSAFHPNGFTLCKWPCLEHTIPTLGQMSGAPIIRASTSSVVGVTSSGTEEYGMATDARLLFEMTIPFGPPRIRGQTLGQILMSEGL